MSVFDRLRYHLRHRNYNVTDADITTVGETVWVTGYRRGWACCVSLLMSREDAAVLGEMLSDVASDEETTDG